MSLAHLAASSPGSRILHADVEALSASRFVHVRGVAGQHTRRAVASPARHVGEREIMWDVDPEIGP